MKISVLDRTPVVDTGTAIQENISIITEQSQITGLVSYNELRSSDKLLTAMASSTLAFQGYLQSVLKLRKSHSTMDRFRNTCAFFKAPELY